MILKSILDGGLPQALPSYTLGDDLNFSEKREISCPCRISQDNDSIYSISRYPTYGTNNTYNYLSCFTKFVPHTQDIRIRFIYRYQIQTNVLYIYGSQNCNFRLQCCLSICTQQSILGYSDFRLY